MGLCGRSFRSKLDRQERDTHVARILNTKLSETNEGSFFYRIPLGFKVTMKGLTSFPVRNK